MKCEHGFEHCGICHAKDGSLHPKQQISACCDLLLRWIDLFDEKPPIGSMIVCGELRGNGFSGAELLVVDSYVLACFNGEEYGVHYSHKTHWHPLADVPAQ